RSSAASRQAPSFEGSGPACRVSLIGKVLATVTTVTGRISLPSSIIGIDYRALDPNRGGRSSAVSNVEGERNRPSRSRAAAQFICGSGFTPRANVGQDDLFRSLVVEIATRTGRGRFGHPDSIPRFPCGWNRAMRNHAAFWKIVVGT